MGAFAATEIEGGGPSGDGSWRSLPVPGVRGPRWGPNTTSHDRIVHGFFFCRAYLRPEARIMSALEDSFSISVIKGEVS